MGDKPTYLGLLNAIANGEGFAHRYFSAWAAATDDPDVQRTLRTVAAREGEHAMSFAKRIDELGYAVLPREPDERDRRAEAVATGDADDLTKLEALGYGVPYDHRATDVFAGMFADKNIDPITGTLLGRYIAEERDTERRLRECCAALRGRAAVSA
jgi:rubrerythrin